MQLWFTKAATILLTFLSRRRAPEPPGTAKRVCKALHKKKVDEKGVKIHYLIKGMVESLLDSVLDKRQRIQRGGLWLND
jgi:hypothetical protein